MKSNKGIQNMTAKMVFVLATVFAFGAQANSWQLDLSKGSGQVEFNAVGKPKMLKIHGKGSQATGSLIVEGGKVTGKAIFDLNSLDTGISLRNTHMKEKYLETGKHPQATLEIVSIKLPANLASDFSADAPFSGKLTLKGVTKDVKGIAKLKKSGSELSGEVEFDTTVGSFNIELPSFAGVTMADEVKVKVEFKGPMVQKSGGQKVANK